MGDFWIQHFSELREVLDTFFDVSAEKVPVPSHAKMYEHVQLFIGNKVLHMLYK